MHETWLYIGSVITVILGVVTAARVLFYTKSEIDKQFLDFKMDGEAKINELKAESDTKDATLLEKVNGFHAQIKEELAETKESIFKNIVETERNTTKITQEIYDRLNENKQVFDDYNKNMIEIIAQVKQDNKQISNDFIKLLSEVKDELKTDYVNRYNDLLTIMNTKVNLSDFDRLETKFDHVTETITELRTIIQMQQKELNNNKD